MRKYNHNISPLISTNSSLISAIRSKMGAISIQFNSMGFRGRRCYPTMCSRTWEPTSSQRWVPVRYAFHPRWPLPSAPGGRLDTPQPLTFLLCVVFWGESHPSLFVLWLSLDKSPCQSCKWMAWTLGRPGRVSFFFHLLDLLMEHLFPPKRRIRGPKKSPK